jgi:hypothetical protein
MQVDPVQPPENQFYIDALFGRSLRQMVEQPDEGKFRAYSLSTDLDDAVLYRHLDFQTIEDLRRRATKLFDTAASRKSPAGPSLEDQKLHAAQRVGEFEVALVEYLHIAARELTQRFSTARRPSLERGLLISIGTQIEDSAVDKRGRPRPLLTAVVSSAGTAAAGATPTDLRAQLRVSVDPLTRYLTNFVSPLLWISDASVAAAAETLAGKLRLDGLIAPKESVKFKARLVPPTEIDSPGPVTDYGTPH